MHYSFCCDAVCFWNTVFFVYSILGICILNLHSFVHLCWNSIADICCWYVVYLHLSSYFILHSCCSAPWAFSDFPVVMADLVCMAGQLAGM